MTAKEIRSWHPTTDPDVMRNLEMLREIAAQLAELNAFLRLLIPPAGAEEGRKSVHWMPPYHPSNEGEQS